QAEDGIRDFHVTGVQTCALPISAIHAAELGAQVTVVDLSETMLRKFQEQLDRENKQFRYPIRKLHLDIFKVDEVEQYDMVVANRSEEHRVGKVCRARRDRNAYKR